MRLTNDMQQRITTADVAHTAVEDPGARSQAAGGWSAGDTVERSSQPSALPPPVEDRCGTSLPAPIRPYGPRPRPEAEYPRAVAFARFLYDAGSLGPSSQTRPAGDLAEVMIRRGSLVDGEDFGILVDRNPIDTPFGSANRFYVFTKLAEMAGPTPTKYYGPFDDSILPNE